MRQYVAVTLLAGSLGLAGCDLDVTNPNAPTQQTVVTSAEGLIALGVGLQARMGSAAGALIYGAGLVTDDARLVEALGEPCAVVGGSPFNLKITTTADLRLASALLAAMPRPKRDGPSHPFADEKSMW